MRESRSMVRIFSARKNAILQEGARSEGQVYGVCRDSGLTGSLSEPMDA